MGFEFEGLGLLGLGGHEFEPIVVGEGLEQGASNSRA
jgi:hypothetical protein